MPVDTSRSTNFQIRPVIVAGGGAAGINAALACRKYFPDRPVTIVDPEAQVGYYRPLLAQFMLGKLNEQKLFFRQQNHDPMLALRLNSAVVGVDLDNRQVRLDNGEVLAYDRLILAPGGRPFVPPVCRSRTCRLGVFPVRSLADARAVRRWLPDHRRITVLGGGLVGVKTAVQFVLAGFKPILVEKEAHLLPNLLAPGTAHPVADHLRNLGVDVRTQATVEDIRGGRQGDLKEVRISGTWAACDTLLVAIGSTPDLGFLENCGLLEDGELMAAPSLQTADRYVFAAGDAVTIRTADGVLHRPWTWPQAVSQGRLAGTNVYRPAPLTLNDFNRVNAQNIAGLPLVVLGGRPEYDCTVSEFAVPPQWWREWHRQKNRVVGGALLGDISGAGPLHYRMTTGVLSSGDAVRPHAAAFSGETWKHLKQQRTVRCFHVKGKLG